MGVGPVHAVVPLRFASVPNPIRATVEGIGRLLVYLRLITASRAQRIAGLAWPRLLTGLARMSPATPDVAMVAVALSPAATAGVGSVVADWNMPSMLVGRSACCTTLLVSQACR